MSFGHTFHIPVLGIGYTVDTPLKVAHLGIDSVMSIGDDDLLEKLRKYYSEKFHLDYSPVRSTESDARAARVTAYLNMIHDRIEVNFSELKEGLVADLKKRDEYFASFPQQASIRTEYESQRQNFSDDGYFREWINERLKSGSADVNIMTKADKVNYIEGKPLPVEYNDAHAGLRGFANSRLRSAIVFSAGMNPRLFSYAEHFNDFYPDQDGTFIKRIILKVSDYRSARIQGMFLAKKGLWVSEFRIESGLNCGGHAFATDGSLMGPILAEFRDQRIQLLEEMFKVFEQALTLKGRIVPDRIPATAFTAQGGVGTFAEHQFLLEHYQLDSVGWGSPFLLVPEAVNVDENTLSLLKTATEKDLYLSEVSPLGVPFNTLRGNTMEELKNVRRNFGRPGSPCTKKYLSFNAEFSEIPICQASRKYQHLKIKELKRESISPAEFQQRYAKIVEKECLCEGLGKSVLLVNEIAQPTELLGVSVCPGPNIAYFSRVMSLKEIMDHIYGRINVIVRTDRPHMFVKEIELNINYFKNKLLKTLPAGDHKIIKEQKVFTENLQRGIAYYSTLFSQQYSFSTDVVRNSLNRLKYFENELSFIS